MVIIFKEELEAMRRQYAERASEPETLLPPYYLSRSDGLRKFFAEYRTLYEKGNVYYGSIVQANKLLFKYYPQTNHPADIIYSEDEAAEENPLILRSIASELYGYKNNYGISVPNEHKAAAIAVRDELDRTSSQFVSEEYGIKVYFRSIIVFRQHIPGRKLKGAIVPVLAAKKYADSVMILPEKYWTEKLKKMYKKHVLP